MSELDAVGPGDSPPPYMLFVVVFLFFVTGLLGFLVCHTLKKKGYRCRAGDLDDEEDEEEELKANTEDEDEENQDTVEQILKCIIENEANMDALNEMLGNQNVCVRHDPRVRKESLAGVPPHHHTVHSGGNINSCLLCAQVQSKKGRRQSKTPRFKQRPGEQTVLSVGRFRVTHSDKKHGGSSTLAESGNQLDQSQDSDDRKEGDYNLRNMFKDVQAPNGPAQTAGKRRRSLTIFGLRRGSDTTGIKLNEGARKEIGRFGVQKPPVVLEELLPRGKKAVSPSSVPGDLPKADPTTDATKNLMIPLTSVSEKTAIETIEESAIENRMEEVCDPGPQQTSTPISPGPGLLSGLSSVKSSSSSEACLGSRGLSVAETAPDVKPSVDANLTLMSLDSSSHSNLVIDATPNTLLNIATSPRSNTPTPVTSSRNTPVGDNQDFPPKTTPDPQSPASLSTQIITQASDGRSNSKNMLQQHKAPEVIVSEDDQETRATSPETLVESTLPHQPADIEPSTSGETTSSSTERNESNTISFETTTDTKKDFSVVQIPDQGE